MQVFNFLTGLQDFLTHSPSGFPHSQPFRISSLMGLQGYLGPKGLVTPSCTQPAHKPTNLRRA
eukprot:1178097-Prorocentrum_minimum.AAC.2